MKQSVQAISNLLSNGCCPSDIARVMDLLRSSSHGAALSPSIRMNKKRAVHEIYDDNAPAVAFRSTIPKAGSDNSDLHRAHPAVDILASFSSKKCRQEEVLPTNKVAAGGSSKVLPSTVGLSTYAPTDVLSGRGGGTNQHEGNCFFRSLINANREKYLRAKKNDKPFISLSIVSTIRQRNGRFLKKDEKLGLWFEIGDAAAREKTSQALRQRAPEYRRQMIEKECEVIRQQQQQQQQTAVLTTMSPLPAPVTPRALSTSSTKRFDSLATPVSPYTNAENASDAMLQLYSTTLRQARRNTQEQIQQEALRLEHENAQEALRLEQKLCNIKMLELMILMGKGSAL